MHLMEFNFIAFNSLWIDEFRKIYFFPILCVQRLSFTFCLCISLHIIRSELALVLHSNSELLALKEKCCIFCYYIMWTFLKFHDKQFILTSFHQFMGVS